MKHYKFLALLLTATIFGCTDIPKEADESAKQISTSDKRQFQQKTDFSSLLKNLAYEPYPQKEQMSTEEQKVLMEQFASCWSSKDNVAPRANAKIEMRLTMNQDRTVRETDILNKQAYNNDSDYRAVADHAVKALKNPKCLKLNLPPEKYEIWKTFVVSFAAAEML